MVENTKRYVKARKRDRRRPRVWRGTLSWVLWMVHHKQQCLPGKHEAGVNLMLTAHRQLLTGRTLHKGTHNPWRKRVASSSPFVKVGSAISCLDCRNEAGVMGGIVWVTFTTCMFILKLRRPLSPPSFTHTSLEGMVSCQMRPLGDLFSKR